MMVAFVYYVYDKINWSYHGCPEKRKTPQMGRFCYFFFLLFLDWGLRDLLLRIFLLSSYS